MILSGLFEASSMFSLKQQGFLQNFGWINCFLRSSNGALNWWLTREVALHELWIRSQISTEHFGFLTSGALDFRAVCGSFMPVYVNFIAKRSKLKTATKTAIVSFKTKVDGVILGLPLSYLFWGSLLLQCGDVEQNPGPTDNIRLTRLASESRAANTEMAVCS